MIILAPLGWLYGGVMQLRNALYDRGILRSYDLGAKTISVGNITTGGTGKTPLVAYIVNLLADNGEKVCVLTRGYGRKNKNDRVLVSDGKSVLVDAETGGDEPVELALKLLGKAIVVADADRVAAARWAKDKFGITSFVLDDAFQHRRAKRDLDIVCIDATDPFGNGLLLPAGKLRESVHSLDRADAVVITRSDQNESIEELEESLRKENAEMPIFRSSTQITEIVMLEEFHSETQRTQRESLSDVYAFTGIGNPQYFFRSLEREGIPLVYECSLEDHFYYSQEKVEAIEVQAKFKGAKCMVTTAKDAVKLAGLRFSLPCFVVKAQVVFDDPNDFTALIFSV